MRRAFISPTKYVQGENELLNLGYFVKTFGDSALLIAHPDDVVRVKDKLDATKQKFNITLVESGFRGNAPGGGNQIAGIGQGASMCLHDWPRRRQSDRYGKMRSRRRGSDYRSDDCGNGCTDKPFGGSLYPEGEFDDYAYFKQSPSVVMIDTTVIAKAPTRFLVAGMGMRSRLISKQERRLNRTPMSMPVCLAAARPRNDHRVGTCQAMLRHPARERISSETGLRSEHRDACAGEYHRDEYSVIGIGLRERRFGSDSCDS